MSILDAVLDYGKEMGVSQKDISSSLHIDPTYLSKMKSGERKWPEHLDPAASKMNWRVALQIIDERTGGWIRNRFKEVDPHPSALKEMLIKEIREVVQALNEVVFAAKDKSISELKNVQNELRDVLEIGAILYGSIDELLKEGKL